MGRSGFGRIIGEDKLPNCSVTPPSEFNQELEVNRPISIGQCGKGFTGPFMDQSVMRRMRWNVAVNNSRNKR